MSERNTDPSVAEEVGEKPYILSIDDVRRILSGKDNDGVKRKLARAERALEDLKKLLIHAPLLHHGRLSTGTIDYAAFRVETLSLIFEKARQSLRTESKNPDVAYERFLFNLGSEVGLTFGRDLMNRLAAHDLIVPFQEEEDILRLWASFENDTGAGETDITHYSPARIVVRLKGNPLRRAESDEHSHCGFYRHYIASLINEISKLRARHLQTRVKGADVTAQTVIKVVEETTAANECVFVMSTKEEKLTRAFDLLVEGYYQFSRLPAEADYSACMGKARAALVAAQMETVGIADERPGKQLYQVYKGILPAEVYRDMDGAYQRISAALHQESQSSGRMSRKNAWELLLSVRRSVFALELLELQPSQQVDLRNQSKRLDRLATIELLTEEAGKLSAEEKAQLKELVGQLKRGGALSEDRQITFAEMAKKAGEKVWEVAKPIIADVMTAALKKQLGLD